MTKRTISWLLCLMMIVGLFAGLPASASAANTGITIDPPKAVIYQTGDAAFTVSHGRKGNDPRYDWDFPNRRGNADQVRLEILDALER